MNSRTASKTDLQPKRVGLSRQSEVNKFSINDFVKSVVLSVYQEYKLYRSKKYYRKKFPKSNVTFNTVFSNVDVSVGVYSSSNTPIEIYTPFPGLSYNITIGSYTQIGKNMCIIIARQHTPDLVSNNMHKLFLNGLEEEFNNSDGLYRDYYSESYGDVVIGNDVWIGNDVTVRGGIRIGDGAVVGADSLILKDVAPYSIVAGVPAKEIKTRFSKETIEKLIEISFWNWDPREIEENKRLFYDVDQFVEKYNRKT